MKYLLTGLLAISAFTFSASAQVNDNRDQVGMHQRRGGNMMMMDKLNLSDAQRQQMKSINDEFRAKMEDLRSNTSLSDADRQARRKSLMDERNEKVDRILTPAQRSQFAEMRKDQQERFNHNDNTGNWRNGDDRRDGNQGRGQNWENMKQDLGLSDDQVTRLKASNESFRDRAKAIEDNQTLNADDKRMQLEKLRAERRENMKSILTADQLNKMESMNKGRKEKFKEENGKEKMKIKDKN